MELKIRELINFIDMDVNFDGVVEVNVDISTDTDVNVDCQLVITKPPLTPPSQI